MDLTLRTTPSFLEGVYMVTNAMEDCVAVIPLGPCVYEQIAQTFMAHDYFQTLLRPDHRHRVAVTFADQTTGTLGHEKALEDMIRKVISALPATSLVIVPQIVRLAMTGEDLTALCGKLTSELQVPIVYLKTPSLVRDGQDALRGLMEPLLNFLPERTGEAPDSSALLLGYPFERREGDHSGNVAELRSMIEAIGFDRPVIWPSGETAARWSGLGNPGLSILFPIVHLWKTRLEAKGCSPVLNMPLPVGLRGSAKWIHDIARATGGEEKAGAYCESQMKSLAPTVSSLAVRRLAGRVAVVIADESWLDPICRFFRDELGIHVLRALLRKRSVGNGSDPAAAESGVPADPSVHLMREEVERALLDAHVDFLMGNGWEHNIVRQTHPHIPFFEFGYPCFERHYLSDRPFLGFRGALTWAEELINLLAPARNHADGVGQADHLPRAANA